MKNTFILSKKSKIVSTNNKINTPSLTFDSSVFRYPINEEHIGTFELFIKNKSTSFVFSIKKNKKGKLSIQFNEKLLDLKNINSFVDVAKIKKILNKKIINPTLISKTSFKFNNDLVLFDNTKNSNYKMISINRPSISLSDFNTTFKNKLDDFIHLQDSLVLHDRKNNRKFELIICDDRFDFYDPELYLLSNKKDINEVLILLSDFLISEK